MHAAATRPAQPAPAPTPCNHRQPRIASQAVLVGDDVWLIGGWDPSVQGPSAFLDDFWKLNTKTWAWTKVEPEVRAGSTMGGVGGGV